MTWLWWAPLAAAVLHIVEEFVYPGGFAEWDRSYRPGIRNSITPRLHIIVNVALLLACVQVGLLANTADAEVQSVGAVTWLTLAALFFSNSVYHIVGTIRTGTRSPGVVTAVTLYMPLAAVGYWYFVRHGIVSLGLATAAAVVGGSYHFWAALMHRVRARHRVE
jgi:hypothetical protein